MWNPRASTMWLKCCLFHCCCCCMLSGFFPISFPWIQNSFVLAKVSFGLRFKVLEEILIQHYSWSLERTAMVDRRQTQPFPKTPRSVTYHFLCYLRMIHISRRLVKPHHDCLKKSLKLHQTSQNNHSFFEEFSDSVLKPVSKIYLTEEKNSPSLSSG